MIGSLYSDTPTWLHGRPALAKLLAVGGLGSALFVLEAPAALAGAAAAAALLAASLGAALRPLRRMLLAAGVMAALVAAFHLLLGQPVLALQAAVRLVAAAVLGAALSATTRFDELLAALERLLAPLSRLGVRSERLALQLGLMLRFVEHFFVQWQRMDEAWRLRTGRPSGVRILAALCIRMLQSARRVADALDARLGPPRS